MAIPDFTKIWGSNVATSDRYTFTDSDYLQGWAYVGSVPPAREAFDTLFRDIDTKMAYLNQQIIAADKSTTSAITQHNISESAHSNRLYVSKTADKPASMADTGMWVEIVE